MSYSTIPSFHTTDQGTLSTEVDDRQDGVVAYAIAEQTCWQLSLTSTAPLGPYVLATRSGTGRWVRLGALQVVTLPPPKVRMVPGDASPIPGLTRNGESRQAYGTLRVSIDGLPEVYRLDPAYRCQIELLRYVPKRKKGIKNQPYEVLPQGFYHPSTNGAGNGSGGTRGGTINGLGPDVVRVTEWSVVGLPFGGSVDLPVADVLLPYFQVFAFRDYTGNEIQALSYYIGRTRRRLPNGVWSYAPNPPRGVFVFRFSVWDVANERWVNGPVSERVFARPKKWPTRPQTDTLNPYPRLRLVTQGNVDPACVELVASVGGVVR